MQVGRAVPVDPDVEELADLGQGEPEPGRRTGHAQPRDVVLGVSTTNRTPPSIGDTAHTASVKRASHSATRAGWSALGSEHASGAHQSSSIPRR